MKQFLNVFKTFQFCNKPGFHYYVVLLVLRIMVVINVYELFFLYFNFIKTIFC